MKLSSAVPLTQFLRTTSFRFDHVIESEHSSCRLGTQVICKIKDSATVAQDELTGCLLSQNLVV